MEAVLSAALDYRRRGFSPIFCDRGNKKPLHKSWQHLQKTPASEAEIRAWAQAWPVANVGIITGAMSGLVVLDVDGYEGMESIKQYHLPITPCVATGKGFHYYFKHPGFEVRNFVRKAPGLDLRGDGGYVVAPPSIHASGRVYTWSDGLGLDDVDLADMPEWLIELLKEPAATTTQPIDWEAELPQGTRDEQLTKRAGQLLKKMPPDEVLTLLKAWNQKHCKPPLPDAEVEKIVKSIAQREAQKKKKKAETISYSLTDLGNARRLVARYGENIRYCHPWGCWLIWDGRRWLRDETGEIHRMAKATVEAIAEEAKTAVDDDEMKAILSHATRSESKAKLEAMVNLAQSEPGIPVSPDQLDSDPWLLNCQNGVFDLKSGELLPHDRDLLLTKLAPVNFNPEARCEVFEAFLNKIMAENDNLIDFLQRAFGYALTGDISEHKIFFLYGNGANGKSTLMETIKRVLGDYTKQTPITTFTLKNNGNESTSNDLARLKGARLVSATEAEESHRLAESLVKSVTGGDTITCRFLFKEYFEYTPQFKVFISTNKKPYISGTDCGMWRRVCLIPFNVSIPEEEQDRKLLEKLRAEQEGILIWLLAGCLRWQRLGLEVPDEVRAATEEYKVEMDWLAGFLEECCVVMEQMSCGASELYDEYVKWANRNGEHVKSQKKFGAALAEKGFNRDRPGTGRVRWIGIGLRYENTDLRRADFDREDHEKGRVIPMNLSDRWG